MIIISKVSIVQNGPDKVSRGEEFKIQVQVQNLFENKITDVKIVSQTFCHDFGDIEPNRIKITNFDCICPSVESLKMDFGEDVEIPSVYSVNSVVLTFNYEGESYNISSNKLDINIC